ncbi:MAG: M48 family metalloprotease [Acidobacteriota bacterium]
MLRRKTSILVALSVLMSVTCAARKPGEALKPGFNLFSKQQDIQLGQEAAAQVRQQYQVVQNQELQNYIKRIGDRLASTPEAKNSGFPFSFTLLNSKEVNAFALPGGPAFVFTGLIKVADNEGELAGVLAHELSHVILRHGTNQVSKANLVQLPAQLAGSMIGGSTMGQLVNLGLGLGLNGLFLKFSRTDETQADALGARIMNEAGYNPIEMANMFEKLQSLGGQGGPEFLSDHPNPGNRVKAVEAEIQALPRRTYDADTGTFQQQKQLVAQLPEAPKRQKPVVSTDGASSGYKRVQTQNYSLEYPQDWQGYGDQNSSALTIAPQKGIVQGQNGQTAVGAGIMISYFFPDSGSKLQKATEDLIHHLQSQNPSMQVAQSTRKVKVAGAQALQTGFTSQSPFGGNENDILVTVERPEGLFYVVFVGPEQSWSQLQPVFDHVLNSIQFSK